jgi:eukaryotic-like serine/threonine-protein kinase
VSTLAAPAPPDEVDLHGLPPVGTQVRYEGSIPLGEGGMGTVVLCRDGVVGRLVARKRMHPELSVRSDMRARFLREARVQGQLDHPTVVPVYDLGVAPDGAPFFTMRRVAGDSLEDILFALAHGAPGAEDRYPMHRRLWIFQQICQGVGYAHARGVVHRDIKPANVMLGHWGEVYVLDWGLAKVLAEGKAESEVRARTTAGQILGTLGYMAPEQVGAANAVDARADVYALGAILFELLALVPLHRGQDNRELLRSTQIGANARPSEVAPERQVPPELDAICERATALDPEKRHASAQELHDAVERYLEGDRDLSQRKRMAARYAQAAQQVAHIDDAEHRAVALREAGRALALDPESREAAAVLVSLAMKPPQETPPEIAAARQTEEDEEARMSAKLGLVVYGALLGVVLALALAARTSIALYACGAALAAAMSLCLVAARGMLRIHSRNALAISACVSLAIALATPIAGVLVLLPPLAVAHAMSLNLRALDRYRWIHVGMACAAVVVPYVLDWAGVIGPYDRITEGGIVIGVPIAPVAMPFLMVAITALAIVGACVLVWRLSDGLAKGQEQAQLRLWHLRQLAPQELQDAPPPTTDGWRDRHAVSRAASSGAGRIA